MISATTSCFPVVPQGLQMFSVTEDVGSGSSSLEASSGGPEAHTASFLYNLSLLRDKVHQVQSLVSILISPEQTRQPDSAPIAIASMGTLVQEIIVTASSMMFTCQQMALCATSGETSGKSDQFQEHHPHNPHKVHESGMSSDTYGGNSVGQEQMIQDQRGQGYYSNETLDWFSESYNNSNSDDHTNRSIQVINRINETREGSPKSYDIVELDAADLLAKYTHYCQVCGKGFKRDANLRMHMRAHGDEYKTSAALANPMKHNSNNVDKESSMKVARKYSCPQEGCRWNQKHAKFQPLKSIICVKNHYKRSHCPKMYVCKRCNRKQFSVLSDLRTHEKHCGDLRWQCSCGTTFSRKDKLMGHVALFVGHKPAASSMTKQAKVEQQATQMPFHGHQ